jgi:hypothetical protein
MLTITEIGRLPFIRADIVSDSTTAELEGATTSFVDASLRAVEEWGEYKRGSLPNAQCTVLSPRGSARTARLDSRRVATLQDQLGSRLISLVAVTVSTAKEDFRGEAYVKLTINGPFDEPSRSHRWICTLQIVRRDEPTRRHRARDDFDLVERFARCVVPTAGFEAGWAINGTRDRPALLNSLSIPDLRRCLYAPSLVRGYDWVQFLSSSATARLRQTGRDLERIPVDYVGNLRDRNGHEVLLLALNRSPYEVNETSMRKLRSYLEPVLIHLGPPDPGSAWHDIRPRQRPLELLAEDWFSAG